MENQQFNKFEKHSSERDIDVYPAGHGGTSSPPSISSFTSCPPLPPLSLKAERGFTPSPPLGWRGGGQLVKLEIDGGELVPPCPAGYTSISRSLLYQKNLFNTFFLKPFKSLLKQPCTDWFIFHFPVLGRSFRGGGLECFDLFSGQLSVNFPDEISRKTRAPNV